MSLTKTFILEDSVSYFMMRFCNACGKPLPEDVRAGTQFCPGSSTCRVRAFRIRKKAKIWSVLEDSLQDRLFYQR